MSTPIWDIAHVAHVEMLTPRPDESLKFFTDVMGMSVSHATGDSVYLRAYDDYEHHSLLYCALHMPDPRAPGYAAAVHDELAARAGHRRPREARQ